jgi:hypothetical protein
LRRDAKRLAKAEGLSHTCALDKVANAHGFKNWQLLRRSAGAHPDPDNPFPPPAQAPAAAPGPAILGAASPPPVERPAAYLPTSTGLYLRMGASRADVMMMKAILERFERLIGADKVDRLSTMMDLEACHCNGCPLDLTGLLEAAGDADLVHDVAGISRHLNRQTGVLVNHFHPRYAANGRL